MALEYTLGVVETRKNNFQGYFFNFNNNFNNNNMLSKKNISKKNKTKFQKCNTEDCKNPATREIKIPTRRFSFITLYVCPECEGKHID
jgi:hypothetical protein